MEIQAHDAEAEDAARFHALARLRFPIACHGLLAQAVKSLRWQTTAV